MLGLKPTPPQQPILTARAPLSRSLPQSNHKCKAGNRGQGRKGSRRRRRGGRCHPSTQHTWHSPLPPSLACSALSPRPCSVLPSKGGGVCAVGHSRLSARAGGPVETPPPAGESTCSHAWLQGTAEGSCRLTSGLGLRPFLSPGTGCSPRGSSAYGPAQALASCRFQALLLCCWHPPRPARRRLRQGPFHLAGSGWQHSAAPTSGSTLHRPRLRTGGGLSSSVCRRPLPGQARAPPPGRPQDPRPIRTGCRTGSPRACSSPQGQPLLPGSCGWWGRLLLWRPAHCPEQFITALRGPLSTMSLRTWKAAWGKAASSGAGRRAPLAEKPPPPRSGRLLKLRRA